MANFGDNITIDNTNPFNSLTEFRKSILNPLEERLSGKTRTLVMRTLCMWNEGKEQKSGYLTTAEMDQDPLLYVPMKDDNNTTVTRSDWELRQEPSSIRIVNDKGVNFIINELQGLFNDKIIFGHFSRDEAVDMAADFVDGTFSYIIFNEAEYELRDPTQLIIIGRNLCNSLYAYLSGIAGGEYRNALVTILTGGGIKVSKDETPQESQGFGERIRASVSK